MDSVKRQGDDNRVKYYSVLYYIILYYWSCRGGGRGEMSCRTLNTEWRMLQETQKCEKGDDRERFEV